MKTLLTLTLASLWAVSAWSNSWTQFRGPNTSGISAEADLPVNWSESENLKWKLPLAGEGSSSPILYDNGLFLTYYTGEGQAILRHLIRVDRSSGEVVWEKTVPVWHPEDPARGYITEHGWATNTPVTDGERIYCYFGKAGVFAYDFNGNEVWKAETGSMSSEKAWGSASSPILFEDKVIVPAGDEARAIIAYNKETGEEVWRAEGDRLEQTYGTPVVMKVDEDRTDLIFPLPFEVWGVNPDTGKLRWFAEYEANGNMANTVSLSGDIINISGGYPLTRRMAIKGGGKGDMSDSVLFTSRTASYMTAPVEHEGVLYWIADSGIAFATKPAEEKPLWEERVPNSQGSMGRGKPFYASPVLGGNGLIYAVSRSAGTFVIEPSTEGLKIVTQNKIAGDDTLFNATPAISDGEIYLRSQKAVYCFGK